MTEREKQNAELIERAQGIKFRDDIHKQNYLDTLPFLPYVYDQGEYAAALYLLFLDEKLREHAAEVFDFEDWQIIPESIGEKWQTSTSLKTARLMLNLWNGTDRDPSSAEDGKETGSYYSPLNIFGSEYAEYYVEALKIRLPHRFGMDMYH